MSHESELLLMTLTFDSELQTQDYRHRLNVNVNDLERVQKADIRIIYGKNYESYSNTLNTKRVGHAQPG